MIQTVFEFCLHATKKKSIPNNIYLCFFGHQNVQTKFLTQNHHTYLSGRVTSQWVDGKVNVKVELQALGISVRIFNLSGNVVVPQFKKHFVISIIKRAEHVILKVKKQKIDKFLTME